MKQTKLLAIIVCLSMLLAVFAGCATLDSDETSSAGTESSAPSDESFKLEHSETQNESSSLGTSEEAHAHSFGEWEVIEKSTCTKAGYKQRKCVCGEIESSYLALSRHTEATDKRREATCTEDGLTRGKHCSACQKVLVAQETIKARGHIESEWIIDKAATASEDGKCHTECKSCHAKIKEKAIAATGSSGLAYTVNSDEKSCTITGIGTCRESNIIIPSEIDGYIVTSIDTKAFMNCTLLTSVTIRKGVTSIEISAFDRCTSLTDINYAGTIEEWKKIPYLSSNAFYKVKATVVHCKDGDVALK